MTRKRTFSAVVAVVVAVILVFTLVDSGADARRRRRHHRPTPTPVVIPTPTPPISPTPIASPTGTPSTPVPTNTTIDNVRKSVSNGQIVVVSGHLSTPNSACVANRPVAVIWGPDTAQQNPYGNGTTDASGNFAVAGSAPDGSFITIQIESEQRGGVNCERAVFFGQIP